MSQEKCRKSCKEVWAKRVQKPGETITTYACKLQYLAKLMYPNDRTKQGQDRLKEKFVKGLHKKYRMVQQILGGDIDDFMYFRDLVRKAVKLEKYYETEQSDVDAPCHALSRARTETYGVAKGETNCFEMDLGGIYKVDDWNPAYLDPQEIAMVQSESTDEKKTPSKSKWARNKSQKDPKTEKEVKTDTVKPYTKIKCFNCKQSGHMRFECPKAPAKGKEALYATPYDPQCHRE